MAKKQRKKSSYSFKLFLHRLKIISLIALVIAFLIATYWFIFFSDFFQIKEIKTINDVSIFLQVEKDIRVFLSNKNKKFVPNFLYKLLPQYSNKQYNVLLLSQKELISYLKNKYPEISTINFKLDLKNNVLLLDIKMRDISFLICYEQKCYFADKEGILFSEAPQISGSLINTIYFKNDDFKLGQQIFTQDEMKMFNNIFLVNSKDYYVFKVKSIEMDNPQSANIVINTTNGWQLLMNFNSDLDLVNTVIQNLFADILSGLKDKQNKIQYIDVRDYPQIRYLLH
jgi:hypothetical protein